MILENPRYVCLHLEHNDPSGGFDAFEVDRAKAKQSCLVRVPKNGSLKLKRGFLVNIYWLLCVMSLLSGA